MMIDRLAGNAALKDSVRLMLESRRLTHSVLLVGETGLGAGYAPAAWRQTIFTLRAARPLRPFCGANAVVP